MTCLTSEQCAAPTSCVASRCRTLCATSADCDDGLRCIKDADGRSACTFADEEDCDSVADCTSDAFAACVDRQCQTGCTNDDACVEGVCVEGSCVEPVATPPDTTIASIALGSAAPFTLRTDTLLQDDPAPPHGVLTFGIDPGSLDLDVGVEPVSDTDWRMYTMALRDRGALLFLQDDIREALLTSSAYRTELDALERASTVAIFAEPPDDRAAFLMMIGEPDFASGSSANFGWFLRGSEGPVNFSTDDTTARFPPEAAIGSIDSGPAFAFTQIQGGVTSLVVLPPSGGAGTQATVPFSGDHLDVRGADTAFLVRAGEEIELVRVRPDRETPVEAEAHSAGFTSSCIPGIADRATVQRGNYVVATCSTSLVELRRVRCSLADPLADCTAEPWMQVPALRDAPGAPLEVALEPLPGGVVVTVHRPDGVDAYLVADGATDASQIVELGLALPASYRVNAFTDYQLERIATAISTRGVSDDAITQSIVVVAGLYVDDSDVAQLRYRFYEVTAQ